MLNISIDAFCVIVLVVITLFFYDNNNCYHSQLAVMFFTHTSCRKTFAVNKKDGCSLEAVIITLSKNTNTLNSPVLLTLTLTLTLTLKF